MFQYHPSDMFCVNSNRKSFVRQTSDTLFLRAEGEPSAPVEAFDLAAINALRRSNQWRYYPSLETQNLKLRLSKEQGFEMQAKLSSRPKASQKTGTSSLTS